MCFLPSQLSFFTKVNSVNLGYGSQVCIAIRSKVTIKVYNLLGQEIKQIVNSTESAGYHEVTFNASNLASGIYFYRLSATSVDGKNNFADTKKLILMK